MNRNVVSAAGAAFITAQQKVGVAATGKHFPGLGASAASQNTDAGPVTLNLSAATIRGVDEFPYRAAIAAGVKLVMVSWAVYPSLGSKRPAGAGMDLILCSDGKASQGLAAVQGLRTAYNNGRLNQAAFTRAVTRILTLRASLPG